MQNVTLFRGDGIGPEIADAVVEILSAANAQVNFEKFEVGAAEFERNKEFISKEAFASFERNKVLLKAPITTPIGKGFRSLNVTLRNKYDLYANIRPAKSNEAIKSVFKDVDIVTFRENTEDLYVGIEEFVTKDCVHATKVITRQASTRIIEEAFKYAQKHGRKKVTCVHKANILKLSDGLFLEIFNDIAKKYPDIIAEDRIVDAVCMQLVMYPQDFDVMVMPNLYGDIVSDLTSGLIGGLGLLPSSNLGDEYAMFEAVHGSAPDIANMNKANPSALLLSACMMLEYLEQVDCANKIREAMNCVLQEKKHLTCDLGGSASTQEYKQAIIDKLK